MPPLYSDALMTEGDFDGPRERMVRTQLERRDITDAHVLEAMRRVPRHRFVPENLRDLATMTDRSPSAMRRRSASPTSWR